MNTTSFLHFNDADILAVKLADHIVSRLKQALEQKNRASLVVSGGSTPLALFNQLCQAQLEWERVDILLADERCVPHDHNDSNTKLVRETLIKNNAEKANFIAYYQPNDDELVSENIAQRAIEQVEPLAAFDVVILGMGLDAHTASIFPHCPQIDSALNADNIVPIMFTNKTADEWRISQTFSRLINSNEIIVHITGEKKYLLLKHIVEDTNINLQHYPIAAFMLQQQTPVSVYYCH